MKQAEKGKDSVHMNVTEDPRMLRPSTKSKNNIMKTCSVEVEKRCKITALDSHVQIKKATEQCLRKYCF